MMTMDVSIDTSGMFRYHETVIEGFSRFIGDLTEGGRDDIRASWSPVSPSSPGQPPAIDTGELDASMEADRSQVKSFTGYIRANAEHGAPLEFGASHMEPRPFMRPWVHKQSGDEIAKKFKNGGYIK